MEARAIEFDKCVIEVNRPEPRMRDDTMAVVTGTWTGTEWPCARRHFFRFCWYKVK